MTIYEVRYPGKTGLRRTLVLIANVEHLGNVHKGRIVMIHKFMVVVRHIIASLYQSIEDRMDEWAGGADRAASPRTSER